MLLDEFSHGNCCILDERLFHQAEFLVELLHFARDDLFDHGIRLAGGAVTPTAEGGTHLAGFDRALTRSVNDSLLAGSKKLAKLAKSGNDRATKDDVQEGLVAAIKVTFPEPQFRGQTKQELGTPAIESRIFVSDSTLRMR